MVNVENKYIVCFKDHVTPEKVDEHAKTLESNGGVILHRYEAVLNGFAASFDEEYLSVLSEHPDVEIVEADKIVKAC
ncbi:proteinase inhibitor, propeptide [Conidiobolus coronatus NRRL 28638]|uniref:Proteinase inhibitor, propeptide n=1 Tax=Conidiobolus coronatus (strain ATCC 28846 / CBS 209.66 / NRRL 28638) TaxID=796925 RepID=A0A137PGV1_CONC2|nr:proteinase inhibitor, propeptide [Conidiobolus coronatus NRRL 28638]|eukprot:KXN74200.1 proteinase inhibitor, propeptide [Conidiobolus coronatus NRRL 28638]